MIKVIMDTLSLPYADAVKFYAGIIIIIFLLTVLAEFRRLRRNQGGKPIRRQDINGPALRNRLAGQYIDFVVCNKNMQVLALVRLLNSERMEGQPKLDDDYANAVLGTCNYKIIKTWSIKPDILDNL